MGKIQCTICKKSKGVRRSVLEKRIKKFGSEEKLRDNYKCIKCRSDKPADNSSEEHLDGGKSHG